VPGAAVSARLPAWAAAVLLTVALCAPPAVAAGSGGGGRSVSYRGKTSQNRTIQIKGGPGSLALVHFQIRMLCHDGSLYFAGVSGFEPTPVKDGRFSDTEYGHTDVVKWEGAVRAGKVAGRIQVEDQLPSGMRCSSGPVRFTAAAPPSKQGMKQG
jgi:hypothetical protein